MYLTPYGSGRGNGVLESSLEAGTIKLLESRTRQVKNVPAKTVHLGILLGSRPINTVSCPWHIRERLPDSPALRPRVGLVSDCPISVTPWTRATTRRVFVNALSRAA